MGKNVLLGCLTCPCFSSGTHEAPPSSEKIYADTDSSVDSPDLSTRIQLLPSWKFVPLPRERAFPDHAVGIDDQVNFVIRLLEWENETNVAVAVILHGLGGTGKTTLGDAVVATLDIQGWNCFTVVPFQSMRNLEDGQGEIQDLFKKEQAFIYIDNVMVRGGHLQNLLPKSCKKLRLLLTARDEMVVDAISGCGIHTHIYPVRPLHSQDAMELLYRKMGLVGSTQIPHHHISQINEILKICDGVPVVLERVGAFICQSLDKDEAYRRVVDWNKNGKPFSSAEEYNMEKNGLLFDVEELPASAKEPFLDICSFFNGWDWNKVSCILGEDELNSLSKRALLLKKEEYENKVMVRPIILTVGRNMTKGKRFTSSHDLSKALEGNEPDDIGDIKGIWLQHNISEPFIMSAKKLDLMHNSLRVLALGDMTIVVDGQCTRKFKQIIYFQTGLIPCIPFHPTTLQELRFLDCRLPHNSNGVQLTKMSSKLRILNMNGGGYNRQFETASAFGRLRGLRTLKLTEFDELNSLPEELRLLTQLEELDLSECIKLFELPKDLGNLKALTKLSLRSCRSLGELPEDFGSLGSLEELDLGYCSFLRELPSSFEKLSSLKVLNVMHCKSLYHLPDNIGNISSLVRIEFECSSLVTIPPSFQPTSSFPVSVNMQDCSHLRALPEEFCTYLKLVDDLSFRRCESLKNIPKRLVELASLTRLDLYNCTSLRRLPEGFGQLKSLAELNLNECVSLQQLSTDFHCLASLKSLTLEWCEKLEGKWMDSVEKIKTLDLVDIRESKMLIKRCAEMETEKEKEGKSWHFVVRTGGKKSENVLKMAASNLLNGECALTDSRGKPFSLSSIAPNTLLLVMYEHHKDSWTGLRRSEAEVVVKHENPLIPFEMIYVGRYFDELSKCFADRFIAHASQESDARFLLYKLLEATETNSTQSTSGINVTDQFSHDSTEFVVTDVVGYEEARVTVQFSHDSTEFLVTEVVADEEGRKHFSTWENITYSLEKFLLSKSKLYSDLQKLTETPQKSNDTLLKVLFDSGESRTSSIFLRNCTQNIGVDQLHGKTVLLFISVMDKDRLMDEDSGMDIEHLLQSLTEIYSKAKTDDGIEILSIPIPAEVRGAHQSRPGSDLAGFESILKNVPWPVLRNPWLLKKEAHYFFETEWGELDPAILVVVDPSGRICNKNALPLVEKWGTEVYPFSAEKMKQLEQELPEDHLSEYILNALLEKWSN